MGYTRAMSKPEGMSDDDDPAALAKRFLDLWQEEIAGALGGTKARARSRSASLPFILRLWRRTPRAAA